MMRAYRSSIPLRSKREGNRRSAFPLISFLSLLFCWFYRPRKPPRHTIYIQCQCSSLSAHTHAHAHATVNGSLCFSTFLLLYLFLCQRLNIVRVHSLHFWLRTIKLGMICMSHSNNRTEVTRIHTLTKRKLRVKMASMQTRGALRLICCVNTIFLECLMFLRLTLSY